ncbi:hypothetical protein GCM10010129_59430 [Streptomyces fumigatiscleroticus]|nr:hypothetical protein GCM10010129_59430 [Streptomyces fumigatiscleroticus]
MLFSRLVGLPVVSLAGGAELGVVRSPVLDAGSGLVTHLRIRGRLRPARKETVLAWDAVHAVGPEAVLVRSAVRSPVPPPRLDVLGRRVLTETGDERGTVLDVVFDPSTGRVLALFTTHGELPAHRLLGLGDYALVVRAV